MSRLLFGALLLFASGLAPSLVSAQGLGIARGAPRVVSATTYEGRGFDPPPSTGRLDSDILIPLGAGMVAFGDTCTSGACVNVGVRAPGAGFSEGIYAIEGAPLAARSIGLQSGALNAIGVRLRLTNTDTVTLPGARIVVDWAARAVLGLLRGDLQVRLSPCDGVGGGSPLTPVTLDSETVGSWIVRTDAFNVVGDLPVGASVCLSFVNTALLGVDIVALTRLEIAVPTCGNGIVELGEACDLGPSSPCLCDPMTCTVPVDGVPCAGESGACFGHVCREGACVRENLFEGLFVEACEDADPCTFDGCRGGACAAIVRCASPTDACHACDPVARLCDVELASCCLGDADCPEPGPCHTYSCSPAHVCELSVTPDCGVDAEVPDASAPFDAGSDASGLDASRLDASGLDASGLDASGLDASGLDAPFDARPLDGSAPPNVSFAGGGGCRCSVASTRSAFVSPLTLALLALLWARRRR